MDLGITTYNVCTVKRIWNKHIFAVSTILVFALPMAVITILYILIALQLRKSKVVNRGSVSGSSVRLKVGIQYFIFSLFLAVLIYK